MGELVAVKTIFSKNNIFIRMRSISPALRWALVGFCFSMLGNQAYEGSVLPILALIFTAGLLVVLPQLPNTSYATD